MRYFIHLGYDGSSYRGWQRQKNTLKTVQEIVEKKLSQIFKRKMTAYGCGRTDAGVHAIAQVAHVELPVGLSASELRQAMNGNLQKDLRVDSVVEVANDFQARFSATSREYEYHLVKIYSPITRRYAAELKWDINYILLNECAEILSGEHDFTAFCKATAEVESKICTIYEAEWKDTEGKYIFSIRANRFLQHMVRYLVGTMLEVARGRYEVENFQNLVDNSQSEDVVVRAAAKGLFLKKVYYD